MLQPFELQLLGNGHNGQNSPSATLSVAMERSQGSACVKSDRDQTKIAKAKTPMKFLAQ